MHGLMGRGHSIALRGGDLKEAACCALRGVLCEPPWDGGCCGISTQQLEVSPVCAFCSNSSMCSGSLHTGGSCYYVCYYVAERCHC